MRRFPVLFALAAVLTAACESGVRHLADGSTCRSLETREREVPGQKPASEDQTRACGDSTRVAFRIDVVATGLEHPWAVEPLPDGGLLVSERPGRLRIISKAGELGAPISGVLPVVSGKQGGLLDVALSPGFATDRTIYWSFTEPRQGGNGTSVARGVLSPDGTALTDVRVIFQSLPTYDGVQHFGSRLLFGPDSMLFISLGERADLRVQAQQLNSDLGKTLRIRPDGSIPADNPFLGQADARGEIWTLGHRNVQAIAFDSAGQLWNVEHGTKGGDELNLLLKGKNYGWPLAAYGKEYEDIPIKGAEVSRNGMEPPVYYWDPAIAPSGAEFYRGSAFPAWRGSLFVGSLKDSALVRLVLTNNRVTGEQRLLAERKQRVRDVREGPDGFLYIVTDADKGEVWRLSPVQ